MRFPESKIKEAILHSDPEIRQRAISYFSKSCSDDSSIMALVSNSRPAIFALKTRLS